MKSTIEALGDTGQFELHAITGSKPDIRDGKKYLSSSTVLPPERQKDEDIVAAIISLSKRVKSEALLPVWAEDVDFTSRNHELLKEANPVLIPDTKLLGQLVNKFHFAKLIDSLFLPAPRTIEMVPTLDVQETIRYLGLPMLAKPVIGEGGEGIIEISDAEMLQSLLKTSSVNDRMILQQKVPGEDVALTLLADRGKVFSVIMRKRWFTGRRSPPFSPIGSVEFFHDPWLESLGRKLVHQTKFSGIADFDLKVDFASRRAWFLESDPRMMGGVKSILLFGVNIPTLLVEQARKQLPLDFFIKAEKGYFLSRRSIPEWIASAAWRKPRTGPVRTGYYNLAKNPLAEIYGLLFSRGAWRGVWDRGTWDAHPRKSV